MQRCSARNGSSCKSVVQEMASWKKRCGSRCGTLGRGGKGVVQEMAAYAKVWCRKRLAYKGVVANVATLEEDI